MHPFDYVFTDTVSFDNKILAIQALRQASVGEARLVLGNDKNTFEIDVKAMGLRDAKVFVEACMALGVKEYLAEQNRQHNGYPVMRADGSVTYVKRLAS